MSTATEFSEKLFSALTDPALDPATFGLAPDQRAILGANALELEQRIRRGDIRVQVRVEPSSSELEFRHLVQQFLRAGANHALLEHVLGLSRREIDIERQALGLPSRPGRRVMPEESERDDLVQLWRQYDGVPRAERYLALWHHFPTITLGAIHACLVQAGVVRVA